MRSFKVLIRELRGFLILWLTQSFSALGSAMTNFALIVWSYQAQGSALTTALLSVCSYAPYVVMSIFAGALSDRWSKKAVMLASDSFAALCTVAVLVLLQAGRLEIWHLYCLNALNGLMNTVQQPAADVAISLLTPERHYQKASGLRSLANSLINMLTPMFATALLALAGIHAVILFDLFTFFAAFLSLLFLVKLPAAPSGAARAESVLRCARQGLRFLKGQRGILHLILFLAAINFTASVYNAAFPAMLLSRQGGGEAALGAVNTATGAALLLGSAAASALPPPKSRVRAVCNTLLLAMSTENFFLAFGRSVPVWCLGAVLGWAAIPLMNANLDVLMRTHIPIAMQGRVFAARNTLQFFTIPLGYFAGGLLVDKVFEPLMARRPAGSLLCVLFGAGKGSGAALLFFLLGLLGAATCLVFPVQHTAFPALHPSHKKARGPPYLRGPTSLFLPFSAVLGGLFPSDLDAARLRNLRRLLGQRQLQHTIFVCGADVFRIHARNVEAAAERAELALPAQIVAVFVLFSALAAVARRDNKRCTVQINADVLTLKARQLCLQQIAVAFVLHIAAELCHIGNAAIPEAALHIIEIIEQIAFIAAKRNQVKHNLLLFSVRILFFPAPARRQVVLPEHVLFCSPSEQFLL